MYLGNRSHCEQLKHGLARGLEGPESPEMSIPGWRNEDKQNTTPLNKPYYDTDTALLPSFTLSMHMYAENH